MRRLFNKFKKILTKKQMNYVGVLLVLMVIGAVLEAIGVGLMVPLVTAVLDEHIIETNELAALFCSILGITTHRQFILVIMLLLIVIFVVKNLYLIMEYHFQYKFVFGIRLNAQKSILKIYMNRPYEFFLDVDSGEIVKVVNHDIPYAYSLLTNMLNIGTDLIISIVLIITVFIISPIITVATGAIMILVVVIIAKVLKPILGREGVNNQNSTKLTNSWLLQAINGIKDIKISGTEEYFQENYDLNGHIQVEANRKYSVYSALPRMLIEMFSICAVLGVILVLLLMGSGIETLAPALSAFAMAAVKLLPSASRISAGINQISFYEPALDKLINDMEDIRKTPDKVASEATGVLNKPVTDKVELSHIDYSYPNTDKKVLDDASMEIKIGTSVGIVGASGAGKTTAVDILLGLLHPQAGQVLCDGVDIREDYKGWLKHIGYIPQAIFMFNGTIRQNIAFGCKKDEVDDNQVWHAADEAQLGDFIRSLPEGLDTVIGERGIRLSGGQRQRIGIARALYYNPEILVFDEATSALDGETEAAIMSSIDALHGCKTLIIIAHRLTTIESCDRVLRVQEGKIIVER